MNMDLHKTNDSKAVSPLTIVLDDECTDEENTDAIANLRATTIPNTSCDTATVKKPRAKWRKPDDKPHHPRTAYNFFFRLERERMLLGIDHLPILPQDVINLPVGVSRLASTKYLSSKQDKSDHPIHPCAHIGEKLGFAELARNVASKWKKLDSAIKLLFEQKAEMERVRYKNELEAWNTQKRNKKLLQEHSPNASSNTFLESIYASPPSSFPLSSATQSSQGFYSITHKNTTLRPTQSSSIDQHSSNYLHIKHESNQHEFRELYPDEQSWQPSPKRSHAESIGEKRLRQLTHANVISPLESRLQATPLKESDLPLKMNRLINEGVSLSEDLHHLAKRSSRDQCLSPLLREIEHQVEICITEFRRLSSQAKEFFRSNEDESSDEQHNSPRWQVQDDQIHNDSLRNQYQHVVDIPSMLKDVRNVQTLLECSDYRLGDATDNRTCIATSIFNSKHNAFRINSDSVVVQPSLRRDFNVPGPNQFAYNMYENSRRRTDNASLVDTVRGYRSGISGTGRAMQGGHRLNQQNAAESIRDQHKRGSGLAVPHDVGIEFGEYEATQRRHRHFVQILKNESIDSRYFSDDVLINAPHDHGYDGSTCDLGNMECENAFDLEPIFPYYQAM